MKPGDLVMFSSEKAPEFDISKHEGKIALVIRNFVGPRQHDWVVVLLDGKKLPFRSRLFEVISESG